jgi:hypothetical protein
MVLYKTLSYCGGQLEILVQQKRTTTGYDHEHHVKFQTTEMLCHF